ncbi:MAG: bacillithiol biosynthesis cysteine-adding enzyme BshC [Candidatus Koribacter versatilis]|uniref:Putative cysteine ligase BshC n=1 Tax=Candidatus Korobacter versatilis TaxID=658062 RepID=A0A932A8Q2_9BACT|nr:bacillithiol biosynthesis cysteine-adding enzyme BshC [Candidatus Koribacter versatilis]
MKSECLPFDVMPDVSRLFADVMARAQTVRAFYPAGFEALAREDRAAAHPKDRRARVADALERQNRAWGASAATLENIQRLRDGAAAVVTGQQVGLFGGPLFAIYKALTAVKLATDSTHAGKPAVPIFWLATEDHDLAEVNHATLLAADGRLVKVATATRGEYGAPMNAVTFGEEIQEVVAQAVEALGPSEVTEALRAAYKPGETMGSAFARLYSKVFAHSGVVLLDASDPELHRIAAPIYTAALDRCSELNDALAAREKELEKAGYHSQVKVSPSHTLLFGKSDGSRLPLRRVNGGFVLGEQKVSAAELRKQIEEHPEKFSPNVLLRPVVQDHLLPTAAYVGGPAEVAYFAQAAVVYEKLLGRVTPVVPRFAATLVEPRIARLLEKYQVKPQQAFAGEEKLAALMAARNLPADVDAAMKRASEGLEQAIAAMKAPLAALDPTVAKAAEKSAAKMRYQFGRVHAKAARAHLRRSEELRKHAQQISDALYPEGHLQERQVAAISFLARHGPQWLLRVYDAMGCQGHQVVYL